MFPIWRSSFSVCDKAVLVVPSTLSFFLSVNLLISLLNMNEILGVQSNIGSKLFHFFTLFIFTKIKKKRNRLHKIEVINIKVECEGKEITCN